jgi:hypothetical protein
MSSNIYWPTINLETVAELVLAAEIVDVAGPETCFQLYAAMVPSGSKELVPFRTAELTGAVIV